jgi:hypothetical protein
MLPCESIKGSSGLGTTLAPRCFFNWLTWNTGCSLHPSGSSSDRLASQLSSAP